MVSHSIIELPELDDGKEGKIHAEKNSRNINGLNKQRIQESYAKGQEDGKKQGRKEMIEQMGKAIQQIEYIEPNSNGRYNACHDMEKFLNTLK